MKRWLGVLAVLCLLVSAPAAVYAGGPSGVNLSWTDCGTFGTQDKTFACGVNTGVDVLFGSYASPFAVDSLNGNEITLDVITDQDPIPGWWALGSGGCRSGSGSIDFNFTTSTFNCNDYWNGQALGGFGWLVPPVGGTGSSFPQISRRARVYGVCAVALEQATSLGASTETYSFKLAINHQKTTGGTVCAGCDAKVCIQLNTIKLTQNPGVPATFTNPYDGSLTNDIFISNTLNRSFVTYQNPGSLADCAVVPTRNTTWGQVKNLYR